MTYSYGDVGSVLQVVSGVSQVVIVTDPIVKEQGRMVSSNSPTPNALQGPINATE